ncbi:2-polyprenyl-6-methoxyphenol hydroxylase [Streptomyces sp. DvalAA-14]|uniref:FAD-dependent oxidoreductase n=1 Tax=unclassified Streptomyces TaxID=2593676 RepID=UPI00081B0FFC|nr:MULTISPECIES: FAD-dependent oxidoreductase [unclassified Streptomyces]MYS24103.1 FAD-dependent oxidoreductase [Streptomyces sp. SID4948]SCE42633.1 2-polyprenyl-6-methoxyphenol hydroxylase [Streptomyces sp. DvalAA-14]
MPSDSGRGPARGRAVVIGGSLTGMLAAAALSSTTAQVTVVERYALPAGPAPRQGLPQARHAHLLWSGGARAVEQLLPGATERLLAAGARRIAVPTDLVTLTSGGWLTRFPERQFFLACSRDLLDWVVRDLATARPAVRVLPGSSVLRLRGTAAGITGVVIRGADGERVLDADLVVDASGRASATPRWLDALGLPGVRTRIVDSGLGYATRVFRAPPGTEDFPVVNIQADPRRPVPGRNGTLLPIEGGRWLVTLSGTRGGRPTADPDSFTAFARGLRHPVIGDLVAMAEPLGEVTLAHSTVNQRRLYERMPAWPEGLVVLGDALATYNPLYGHGMSVAAQHALVLRRATGRQPVTSPGLARRVQVAAARTTTAAWSMAAGQDLRFPGAQGEPPGPGDAVMSRYVDRLMLTATRRTAVGRALFDVISLSAPQSALMRPDVVAAALAPVRFTPLTDPPFTPQERAALRAVWPPPVPDGPAPDAPA